ncbi:hypothetical protein CRM89_00295 [Nocardia sp. FDAARGOS_372]|uniref:hypothetical protein n=1 Tax=Nocardia sp. FDAARGOS_372 TaxID=2018066 RepID=UPI000BF0F1E9|nr:hypothetical protein [Nocardia sp. FDAARGOS_372]PEH74626.1 hypothetical protein CRM89_00295 [Nocardia sp. FDAARGOS_372]
MRIVSRAELKAMPIGTLYSEFREGGKRGWPFGPEALFIGDCGYINDFFTIGIDGPDAESSEVLFDRQHEMEQQGTAYPVDLATDREGLHDDTLRYLVWEPEDVRDIVARTAWLAAHQSEWNPVRRYRIRRPDGTTHSDFEDDERDARQSARPGEVVEQLFERHETEWRRVDNP